MTWTWWCLDWHSPLSSPPARRTSCTTSGSRRHHPRMQCVRHILLRHSQPPGSVCTGQGTLKVYEQITLLISNTHQFYWGEGGGCFDDFGGQFSAWGGGVDSPGFIVMRIWWLKFKYLWQYSRDPPPPIFFGWGGGKFLKILIVSDKTIQTNLKFHLFNHNHTFLCTFLFNLFD